MYDRSEGPMSILVGQVLDPMVVKQSSFQLLGSVDGMGSTILIINQSKNHHPDSFKMVEEPIFEEQPSC